MYILHLILHRSPGVEVKKTFELKSLRNEKQCCTEIKTSQMLTASIYLLGRIKKADH